MGSFWGTGVRCLGSFRGVWALKVKGEELRIGASASELRALES